MGILQQNETSVTIFTGYLGAGKTTLILSILQDLPTDRSVFILKNEFGDLEVDKELFSLQQSRGKVAENDAGNSENKSALSGVKEILNGCLCCVLVGRLANALEEIRDEFHPDHIIVESSGTAFPAPMVWQIKQLEGFRIDSVVTVVDCLNFTGYEDTSYAARMQAQYTDLLLLNKWDLVDDRALDIVIDRLNDLNDETPKLRVQRQKDTSTGKERVSVDYKLLFGLNKSWFMETDSQKASLQLTEGMRSDAGIQVSSLKSAAVVEMAKDAITSILAKIDKEDVYRIKGFINRKDQSPLLINWAFGRGDIEECDGDMVKIGDGVQLQLMGPMVKGAIKKIKESLDITDAEPVAA